MVVVWQKIVAALSLQRGGRRMRKYIGAKIGVLVTVLTVVFLCESILGIYVRKSASETVEVLTETYLELEVKNAILIRRVEDCKANGNMIVWMKVEEAVQQFAETTIPEDIQIIDATVVEMEELCATTGNKELIQAFQEYKEAIGKIETRVSKVAEVYLAGDPEGAAKANVGMQEDVNAIDESENTFNEVLEKEINSAVTKNQKLVETNNAIAGVLSILYLAVTGVAVLVIIKFIAGPVGKASKQLAGIIDKIKKNEGDLTERISVKSKDEIGQLVGGINNFAGQLQEIMLKIQNESLHMNELVENITGNINNSNENAGSISATMQELSASMEEISATLNEITEGAKEILDASNNMSAKAEESSKYVETIRTRANDIQNDTKHSKDTTVQMIEDIRGLLKKAIENSRSVEKIDELTNEILSISSQTNLLALNASIEAARAGDAGKGFAVVADEIRVLADNSRDTANNIQSISGLVTQAVEELSKNANDMLKFIDETVIVDYDKFVGVANQYQEDADVMDNILRDFWDKAQELANTMSDMKEGIDGINIAVDESAQGATVAAQSTSQLVQALGGIKSEADTNKEISEGLQKEVKRFKHI